MREFKFRAWDSEKKQMILPDYSDWEDFFIEPDGVVYQSFETGTYEAYRTKRQTKNLIVMQFTGLKDKNGKEIYEGDIVKFNLDDGEIEYGTVRFSKEGYWTSKDEGHSEEILSEELQSNLEWELAGNIYENLELLKP